MNLQRYKEKIVDKPALLEAVSNSRRDGRTVVLCHGCFDIVHPGHLRYLQEAGHHGDILVVSITGDAAMDKGPERPYVPQELRAENLAALEFVDWVYVDPHETAADVIESIRPDVYVKGQEYAQSLDPRFLQERELVEQLGGQVVFTSGEVIFSSTDLVRRLGRDSELEMRRLKLICGRYQITQEKIGEWIGRFSRLRVLVIGDTVIDRYVLCDAIDIASESPILSLKQLDERLYVGAAGVVARHLAQLGAHVSLFTCLGEDELSHWAIKQLQTDGVEIHSMLTRHHPVVKTRYLVEESKLLKVEQSENQPMDSRTVHDAADQLLSQAASVDAVVFCDFGYGAVTDGMLLKILDPLRERVGTIVADVSGARGTLLNFRHVDLFCPTERELREALQDFDEGLSTVAYKMLRITQARHLMVTLGRNGVVTFDRPSQDPTSRDWDGRLRSEFLQALGGLAIDPMGCGDAFLSGCTLALACGANLMQSAYLGNAMATLEAAELGNIPVSATRLLQFLATRPELHDSD